MNIFRKDDLYHDLKYGRGCQYAVDVAALAFFNAYISQDDYYNLKEQARKISNDIKLLRLLMTKLGFERHFSLHLNDGNNFIRWLGYTAYYEYFDSGKERDVLSLLEIEHVANAIGNSLEDYNHYETDQDILDAVIDFSFVLSWYTNKSFINDIGQFVYTNHQSEKVHRALEKRMEDRKVTCKHCEHWNCNNGYCSYFNKEGRDGNKLQCLSKSNHPLSFLKQ